MAVVTPIRLGDLLIFTYDVVISITEAKEEFRELVVDIDAFRRGLESLKNAHSQWAHSNFGADGRRLTSKALEPKR